MALFKRNQPPGAAPAQRSRLARIAAGLFLWGISGFGFVVFFGVNLSPWFNDRLSLLFEDAVRVEAHITACEPQRNGRTRENVIRCDFSYSHLGQPYTSQGIAWRSQSPFLTSDGLDKVLAAQGAASSRPADIRPAQPADARLADQRLLAAPPLWFWLLALVVGLVALLIRLDCPATVYHRADLVLDRATGQLLDANNKRRNRLRGLAALKAFTALVVVLACLYGLSNRPANIVKMLGFSRLQAVPAQLVDCDAQRRGGYRGHDQIECAFEYVVKGQTLRGQAESLDFRYFPTRSRIAGEVAQLQAPEGGQPGLPITAYVDPQHPGYAWAFISNDAWVKFSWGLWELELWLALLAASGFLAYTVVRAVRPQT